MSKNTKKRGAPSSSAGAVCDGCHLRSNAPLVTLRTKTKPKEKLQKLKLCEKCTRCAFCGQQHTDPGDRYFVLPRTDNKPFRFASECCSRWCVQCNDAIDCVAAVESTRGVWECDAHFQKCVVCADSTTAIYGAVALSEHHSESVGVACVDCAWACGCDSVHLTSEWPLGRCWRNTARVCIACEEALPVPEDEEEALATLKNDGSSWYHLSCWKDYQ